MFTVKLTFPDEAQERFKSLVAKTEAASPAEVIGNALRLYEELIRRKDDNEPLYERTATGDYVEYQVFQE
jgi:hypothetical protein